MPDRLLAAWGGTGGTLLVAALLVLAPAAQAVTPTPVSCAGLPSAISSATAGEVLQLPPGPCTADLTINNTAAFTLEGATTGGATTLEPVTNADAIISSGANVTFTLSGLTLTGTTNAQAISLTGAGEAVTIEHNTFDDDVAPSDYGGAISIQTPKVSIATQPTVISDNTFSDDSASGGGGIAELSGVPLIVSGNTFTGDSVTDSGGALFLGAPLGATAAVQIIDNTFGGTTAAAGNTSTGTDGGAIYLQAAHAQAVTLSSNKFEHNEIIGSTDPFGSREGGAIFMALDFSDTPFTVTQAHNLFLDNSVDAPQEMPTPALPAGGGAEWLLGVNVNSVDDQFIGNRIAVDDGLPPEGGAVGAFASGAQTPAPPEPGVFTGTNDLFVANSTAARGWGGAIYVGGAPLSCTGTCPGSTVILNDSTVVGNSVDAGTGSEGGAIWGSPNDHLGLRNSIVYGNTPQPELWGFATTSPQIAFSDACTETSGTAVPAHEGNICASPKLAGSGAETAASPTIDAGSNALVPAGLSTDIAGSPRIRANKATCAGIGPAIVDVGAFEYSGIVEPSKCPHPSVKIGGGTLRDRHGKAAIRLGCPKGETYCQGTLTLATRGRHGHTLGRQSFKIPGGKTVTLKVKLATHALGKGRRVNVVATASARDKAGRTAKTHRNLVIK